MTASRDVALALASTDFEAGARDVAQMKVWGSVDPAFDPAVQVAEADSDWIAFDPTYAVRLSAGTGRKTIYARLQDDVCNVTLPVSDFIDLDTSLAVVTITTPVDRGRISKVAPCDTAVFGWQASLAFDRYEVRAVPTVGSPQGAGVLIPTTAGSLNISGTGSFNADTTIMTTIKGTDLEAATPGDAIKIIKIFVRAGGVWTP